MNLLLDNSITIECNANLHKYSLTFRYKLNVTVYAFFSLVFVLGKVNTTLSEI